MNQNDDRDRAHSKEQTSFREERNLTFLNERVVKSIKKEFVKIMKVVLLMLVLGGLAAWLFFVRLKPNLRNELDKSLQFTTDARMTEIRLEERDTKQTDSNGKEKDDPEKKITRKEIIEMVPVVSFQTEQGGREIPAVVMGKNRDVYLLVCHLDFLEGKPQEQPVEVHMASGDKQASLIYWSGEYDLGVIRIPGDAFEKEEFERQPVASIAPGNRNSSGEITFIGNPVNGSNIIEKGTLTSEKNIVSILDAKLSVYETDLPWQAEEEGFVFDWTGHLLGFTNADEENEKVLLEDIFDLRVQINKLLNEKKIKYIGIYGKEVTEEVISTIDQDMPYGIYISGTKDNSPAYQAGIMNGDVLVGMAGKPVLNFEQYLDVLAGCQNRQTVKLEVERKGKGGYKSIVYDVMVGELE